MEKSTSGQDKFRFFLYNKKGYALKVAHNFTKVKLEKNKNIKNIKKIKKYKRKKEGDKQKRKKNKKRKRRNNKKKT